MRLLTKAGLGLATILISIAMAPATKADPITITTGGFTLHNLGDNGNGTSGSQHDSLLGDAASISHDFNGAETFVAGLNPLTFIAGFTGHGSEGSSSFSFSLPITINGQTQMLDIVGQIEIGTFVDSIHILSSSPLTFNFNDFSVSVSVLPLDLAQGAGTVFDVLKLQFTVTPTATPDDNAVPEPATISLLGLGLAGIAAKLKRRRKSEAGP